MPIARSVSHQRQEYAGTFCLGRAIRGHACGPPHTTATAVGVHMALKCAKQAECCAPPTQQITEKKDNFRAPSEKMAPR